MKRGHPPDRHTCNITLNSGVVYPWKPDINHRYRCVIGSGRYPGLLKIKVPLHPSDGYVIDHTAEKSCNFLDLFPRGRRHIRQRVFAPELAAFAHAEPVVRKDIHPQNIFTGSDQISRLLQVLYTIVQSSDQRDTDPGRNIQPRYPLEILQDKFVGHTGQSAVCFRIHVFDIGQQKIHM